MTKRDDSGPAFPAIRTYDGEQVRYPGMSLLDWFAGQIISGLMANTGGVSREMLAAAAYRTADAMLAERSKP